MFDSVVTVLTQQPTFFYIVVFVVSLTIGSFLNVVIYRVPVMLEREWKAECNQFLASANEGGNTDNDAEPNTEPQEPFNLVKPDSTCPKCQHKIRAWENIPVISYLFLGGKCASCKTPISLRYPFVELITALLATFVAWHYGPSTQALWAIFFTYMLISLFFIDLDTMLLPDNMTLPLVWIGLLLSTQHIFVDMQDAIFGAVFGYLSLWSVYWLFKLVTGKEGMGYGDFKLLAAIGTFTGWQGLPVVILFSSFVGAIFGIAIMLLQKKDQSMAIPFGPYLAIAGWLTLLYQEPITNYYFTHVLGM